MISTISLAVLTLSVPTLLLAYTGPLYLAEAPLGIVWVQQPVTRTSPMVVSTPRLLEKQKAPVMQSLFVLAPAPTPTPTPTSAPGPDLTMLTEIELVPEVITLTSSSAPEITKIEIFPEVITVSPTPTSASSSSSSSAIASWAAPANSTNLDCFQIQSFASGKDNLKLVNGIPSSASSSRPAFPLPTSNLSSSPSSPSLLLFQPDPEPESPTWDNTSTVLQLRYPRGSANPGAQPVGGSQIYFSPLDLRRATSVTLEYSVFFPADFDWVKGGKLPGLYGGHRTCSGGDDALSCFSTRMMWRSQGMGELYLYAPKDKQDPSLCKTPPRSYCNADYGLSIGRGSFYFARGGWTTLRQTVRLNTPGERDGTFVLDVDGRQVMNFTKVLYRDRPRTRGENGKRSSSSQGSGELLLWKAFANEAGSDDDGGGDDGLADLIPGILGPIESAVGLTLVPGPGPSSTLPASPTSSSGSPTSPKDSHPTAVSNPEKPESTRKPSASPQPQPIGFQGVFFSTFFGGHGDDWTTPREQYTWFKDFALWINA